MRNWWRMRKGGGGENAALARSLPASNVGAMAGDTSAVTTTAMGFDEDRVDAITTSRSLAVFAVMIRQFSAQHDIEACIAAVLGAFPMQHAAPTGSAVMDSTSAMASAPANRVDKVELDFMASRTPG